jgi:hypothetical protein
MPELDDTTPTPTLPKEALIIFARCPGLFIHAVITASGLLCPAAMFSPAAE